MSPPQNDDSLLTQEEIDLLTKGITKGVKEKHVSSSHEDSKGYRVVKVYPVIFEEIEASSDRRADIGLENFYDIPMEIKIELGSAQINLGYLADLELGDILQLDKGEGEPVDIIIGDERVAEGEVLVIGDRLGVRITTMVGAKKKR